MPALYGMYGGQGRGLYVVYVGVTSRLRGRIRQHLVRRDSSVATGTSAAVLKPDYVTQVRWWEHPRFGDRIVLEAAELGAFDVFEPVLRSRGTISEEARDLYADDAFREEMGSLFASPPSGRLIIPTLQDALEQISELEKRVAALERKQANG